MEPTDLLEYGPPFFLTVTLSGEPVEIMVKDFMFSHLKCDYLIGIDGKFQGYIYKRPDGIWDSFVRFTEFPPEDLQAIGSAIEAAGYTAHNNRTAL